MLYNLNIFGQNSMFWKETLQPADIRVCHSSGFHNIFEGYVGKEEKFQEKAITLTPTRF